VNVGRSKATFIALLVLGLALMLPFDATLTRILGVTCLLAFVVLGVFLVAEPRFLVDDDE
jgi:Ca2+/Na+ antiporter